MAIVERSIGEWHSTDPATPGTMTLAYHYNDQSMRLVDLVCTQTGNTQAEITMQSQSTGDTIQRVYTGPGTSTETIPPGQASRFGVTIDARGRIDGVLYTVRFPYLPE